jgi:hypothetical protein
MFLNSGTRLKEIDTSGKSPAYVQHRKNSKARAGKPVAGFLMWRDISRRCDTERILRSAPIQATAKPIGEQPTPPLHDVQAPGEDIRQAEPEARLPRHRASEVFPIPKNPSGS